MFTFISCFVILSMTLVQSQNISVSFPTFPVNTDIGTCTCDLTANICDISCCCDSVCTAGDKISFGCSSRANQYTKNRIVQINDSSTPVISTVQPTCIKNTSIFTSNSPYIIQKMGELVCIDYQRYSGSEYYQQPSNQTLDPATFVRAIDTDNSVTAPAALPSGVTNYNVGTPILEYDSTSAVSSYYSLPIKLFNNQFCAGSQSITYMNDFTSTCSQLASLAACNGGALSPTTYVGSFCLITSPANPSASSAYVCDNTPATASSSASGTTCTGALQTLTIIVYYSNPTGITSVTAVATTGTATLGASFEQTFTVTFVKSGSSPSSSTSTRNPGYQQGATIIAASQTGTVINIITSQFGILKPLPTGLCATTATFMPIRFGENIRSTCKFTVTSTTTCPDLYSLLIPFTTTTPYIAAYSNPDTSNITIDWLPVISCTSEVGSPNNRECQSGIKTSTVGDSLCYVRLDIQIAYTNIGSINNPQSVLSAVIFHYQGLSVSSTSPLPSTLLVTKSVTFQDISNASVIEQGQIPTPNTRLPANFFYPFSGSHATKSMTFSTFTYFLISAVFILM